MCVCVCVCVCRATFHRIVRKVHMIRRLLLNPSRVTGSHTHTHTHRDTHTHTHRDTHTRQHAQSEPNMNVLNLTSFPLHIAAKPDRSRESVNKSALDNSEHQ